MSSILLIYITGYVIVLWFRLSADYRKCWASYLDSRDSFNIKEMGWGRYILLCIFLGLFWPIAFLAKTFSIITGKAFHETTRK